MNSPQDLSPSSTPEVVALGGTARASPVRAFGILDLIFGPTGRRVRGDRHHEAVRNWIRCTDDTSLRAHAGCEQFVQELRRVQIIRAPLTCYRGRPHAGEMGPPTDAQAGAGRYNRDGVGVLYMSDLEVGVQRELRARPSSGPFGVQRFIWVQRFIITPQARGIADLTMVDPASVIASTCWFAELAAPDGEPTFAFSQFVAALVSDGFDGMRVPGVRGTDAVRYTNVVMFSPAERWRDWIDTSTGPTRLSLDESDA